jgi:hypothetical protein
MENITQLTQDYYHLVNFDHHKDRDCHFYINKTWSYGDDPVYKVEHWGYLYDYYGTEFPTYEQAEQELERLLISALTEQADMIYRGIDEDDADWFDKHNQRWYQDNQQLVDRWRTKT